MENAPNHFIARPGPRIIHGAHAAEGLGAAAYELEAKRVLLVTDRATFELGHATTVLHSLKDVGCVVTVCDEICDPVSEEDIDCAMEFARDAHPQMIVALGGASVMAAAKACSLLHCNGGRLEEHAAGSLSKARYGLPLVTVPVTAGSGAEAHGWAVIGQKGSMRALFLRGHVLTPHTAVLDPELVREEMPPSAALRCGLLALALAVECCVSRGRNALTLAYSREAFRLLSGALQRISGLESGRGVNTDVADLQLGAALAGLAANTALPGVAHALAMTLALRANVPLAEGLALLLPGVIQENAATGALAACEYRLLERLLPEESAMPLADWVAGMAAHAGVQRPAGELWSGLADEAADLPFILENPRSFSPSDLTRTLEEAMR